MRLLTVPVRNSSQKAGADFASRRVGKVGARRKGDKGEQHRHHRILNSGELPSKVLIKIWEGGTTMGRVRGKSLHWYDNLHTSPRVSVRLEDYLGGGEWVSV